MSMNISSGFQITFCQIKNYCFRKIHRRKCQNIKGFEHFPARFSKPWFGSNADWFFCKLKIHINLCSKQVLGAIQTIYLEFLYSLISLLVRNMCFLIILVHYLVYQKNVIIQTCHGKITLNINCWYF